MKLVQAIMALILTAIFMGIVAGIATANVPGVAINAPPPPPAPNVATAGSDAMVKVVATHRDTGSPALHYVDRVMLYDGDKLLKEWKYDQNNYKKDEVWTESMTVPAKADMHLRAVAHCTVHGYDIAGMHVRVLPAGTTPAKMMETDASYAGMQVFGYAQANKASEFASSADTKFIQNVIKAQSTDLKSFQGKMMDWMKSAEGKQYISGYDQKVATQAQMATKQAVVSATPTKVKMKIVSPTTGAPPIVETRLKASPTVSPKAMKGAYKASATVKPTKVNRKVNDYKKDKTTVKASPTAIPRAAMKGGAKASATVKPTMKAGTKYMKIVSPTTGAPPIVETRLKASPTVSPKAKKGAYKASATVKPTLKAGKKYAQMVSATPKAPMVTKKASPTVMPTKVKRKVTEYAAKATVKASPTVSPKAMKGAYKASPTAKPTMKAGTKYLIARDELKDKSADIPRVTPCVIPSITTKPAVKPTASAAKKYLQVNRTTPQSVKTPAQSYGIYGLGGPVPSPPKVTATVRPVPSGSPTPVPGWFTPRYPGEAGAGKNVTVPSPTPVPQVAKPQPVTMAGLGAPGTTGNTQGPCACVDLASDLRYSGRGPGIVGTTLVQPPASAPGPNAVPKATRIQR